MDALESVLHDLTEKCGLDAYLMYGCLLGAVRDGDMIGHDSDADVAYLSAPAPLRRDPGVHRRHPHDASAGLEGGADVRRQLQGLGAASRRPPLRHRRLRLVPRRRPFFVTGSLTGTLDRSALLPFGTVTLEGREIVAPADPERVLAFTYGPEWRVPDLVFHFDHDPVDVRRMDGWFRSSRRRRFWGDFDKSPDAAVPDRAVPVRAVGAAADRGARRAPDSTSAPAPGATRRTSPRRATGDRRDGLHLQGAAATPPGCRKQAKLKVANRTSTSRTSGRADHRRPPRDTSTVRDVYARGLLDVLGPPGARQLLAVRVDGAAPWR